jgi:uncharacterized protein (DUF433 family)
MMEQVVRQGGGQKAGPDPHDITLEWLASGMTVADILADYPDLEADDIYAALAYAARLTQTNHVELLAA